jgi:hypothetical protein
MNITVDERLEGRDEIINNVEEPRNRWPHLKILVGLNLIQSLGTPFGQCIHDKATAENKKKSIWR